MIADSLRRWKHARRISAARAELAARQPTLAPHGLDAPLIVSLTSYGARLSAVGPVIQSLLRQNVAPDRVVLWLSEADHRAMPESLAQSGAEIRICEDLRSYTKIVPSLQAWPDAYIVTADDDVHYGPNWLGELVTAAKAGARVAGHRCHRVTLTGGLPRPYDEWQHNIASPQTDALNFPTGVGGVLYAPGVFHPDVTDAALFRELAPSADDVWLYWMHRLNGSRPAKIGGRFRIIEWPGTQVSNLRSENLQGRGNDRALQNMLAAYGWPALAD